jgi:transposase
MRSAAGSSSRPSGTAVSRTTRSTGSAGCCATAPRTLSPRQQARLETGLTLGDPNGEVDLAWQCYQQLPAAYRAKLPAEGHRTTNKIIDTWHSCPIPEIARLGRTLRQWRRQLLAYFSTNGVSNGGTEAINLLIEKTRRLAHGFRNFSNYRLRILLVADGTRPYRQRPNHAE